MPKKETQQSRDLEAVALYDYQGIEDGELSFHAGDTFRVVKRDNDDWWLVRTASGDSEGFVPTTYVTLEKQGESEHLELSSTTTVKPRPSAAPVASGTSEDVSDEEEEVNDEDGTEDEADAVYIQNEALHGDHVDQDEDSPEAVGSDDDSGSEDTPLVKETSKNTVEGKSNESEISSEMDGAEEEK
ncbi:SLIT-ROBO Rho GTPase-activating protein 1, partial [Thoreauomyces humboldtii]